MLEKITIGRLKTGTVTVIDEDSEGHGLVINSGKRPQDHAFANNVQRTLLEKGMKLNVVQFSNDNGKSGMEITRCVPTT
jgi:hypothetical protein